jgi:hypothetical protein
LEESNFGVKEIVEPGAGKHGKMLRKHMESKTRLIKSSNEGKYGNTATKLKGTYKTRTLAHD